MARSATEVLIGPGTMYVAVEGTAQPSDPTATPAGAYVDVGYSEEGWSFNVDRTVEDIAVAEEIDPLDVMQTAREIHIVGIAVQASLTNLKTSIGGGTITTVAGPPAYSQLVPGSSDTLTRQTLLLRVKAPGTSKARDIYIPHAGCVG